MTGEEQLRKLTDAQTLRALAHPVRISLYQELVIGGPLTATELGERIGETPTTCSFHLRQLAKYGFVEEAGGGKGRARPWRLTAVGMSIPLADADPETRIAGNAVLRLFRDRTFARYQRWQETKASYPQEWQEASDDSDYLLWVTADELEELNRELHDWVARKTSFRERITDPSKRPPGAAPVEALLISYPIALPQPAPDAPSPGDG
ncbi:MAG TPA: helix-turn-helix domain-containing protein [Trebonia sp.]|jgi:DNA-binding transcriptional ArsR family regulator|nr:helix-turn-helix domain-containing protein [Trebonia sp.]